MGRNIEVKARIKSVDSFLAAVASIADSGPTEIAQEDTFFNCPIGRMKLRRFSPTQGELIFYRRSDGAGPKESLYLIVPTTSPDALSGLLSSGYGEIGRVRKRRTLFMVGRTRIHLDRVEVLGDFLELEVVLAEGEPNEVGATVAHELLERLGISPGQLLEGAYLDLLHRTNPQARVDH